MSFTCSRFRAVLWLTALAASPALAGDPGIDLEVTVGADLSPDACAATSSLDVTVGDEVNFCYRVTNHTATTLVSQSFDDSVEGALLSDAALSVAPGATLQYNRIREVAPGADGIRTVTWTARDQAPDYAAMPRAGAFIDLSTRPTAQDLNPPGDATDPTGAGMAEVTVPFAFDFYGTRADSLCVGIDGIAQVGTDRCMAFPVSVGPVPALGMGRTMLPLWDDFAGRDPFCGDSCVEVWGAVYADTVGDAPNRKFVVEWFNLRHESGGANEDRATFELVIDEASGVISFEYLDVAYTAIGNVWGEPDVCDDGICATIGLQRDDARAVPYAFNEAAVSDGAAIDFVPNVRATYTSEASVTLDVGRPVVAAPAAIAGSAAAGTSATVTLALGNTGDHALDWTLDQGTRATSGASAPAYIARMLLEDYPTLDNAVVGFDATAPAAPATVASVHAIFDAATFVDDDFSTEYVVSGWHEIGGMTAFTTYELDRIDVATGEVTRVGETGIGPFELIEGLAWDPVTTTFYAILTATDGSTTTIATIDRYDGHVTRLMPVGGIEFPALIGLAVDRDGVFFSIDQNSGSLVRIDSASGNATVIGPIGDEVTLLLNGSLAFDRAHNVLYLIGATGEFLAGEYVVDLVSGHAGLLGTIGSDAQLGSAFAIADAGGPCANATPAAWLSFVPAAGSVAAGDSAPIAVTLEASGLAEGRYEADLCVRSNDPYRHTLPVHVTFDVGGDTVFADGFDAQ
jgi:plastocyanin